MRYLHTMVRVTDLDLALKFWVDALGLVLARRIDNEHGKFSLVFLSAPDDLENAKINQAPLVELTYNWPDENGGEVLTGGRNFGHLAYLVDDIYAICERLQANGVVINRPPRDGHMAFVRSPENISIELLQKGPNLPPQEPWVSMQNIGEW